MGAIATMSIGPPGDSRVAARAARGGNPGHGPDARTPGPWTRAFTLEPTSGLRARTRGCTAVPLHATHDARLVLDDRRARRGRDIEAATPLRRRHVHPRTEEAFLAKLRYRGHAVAPGSAIGEARDHE